MVIFHRWTSLKWNTKPTGFVVPGKKIQTDVSRIWQNVNGISYCYLSKAVNKNNEKPSLELVNRYRWGEKIWLFYEIVVNQRQETNKSVPLYLKTSSIVKSCKSKILKWYQLAKITYWDWNRGRRNTRIEGFYKCYLKVDFSFTGSGKCTSRARRFTVLSGFKNLVLKKNYSIGTTVFNKIEIMGEKR